MEGEMGKRTLNGRVAKTTTVISDLPESALHHILSHLPTEDSIRTSVLSKQWNSARKSYPFLNFKPPNKFNKPEFKARLREFLNFVDRSLQHFDQNKLCIERMHLEVFGIDQDSVPIINTWLPLALHNGVSDIKFYARLNSEYSIYPLPESTFAVNSNLFSGSFKFFRLEHLMLSSVSLSENVVRDIIRNCPNISHLLLWDICGLETLNISKLNKLVSLQVSTAIKSVYVDAFSLKNIFFRFFGEMFDSTSCCNLREIRLHSRTMTDDQFHHHISKFPLLEFLEISFCHGLQMIKISLQRLKHLWIFHCKGVKAIEIDAPILSSFEFKPSSENVLISVSSKVLRCSMYLSCDLKFPHSSWFLKLREYLGVPFKGVNFDRRTIKLTSGLDMSREVVAKVDCLDLTGLRIVGSVHWVTFLDTMLSGCHPKIVSMTVDSNDEDNCVNFFRKMLVQSECQLCCNSAHCKCWRLHLKVAKIKSINEIKLNTKDVGKIDHKQFLHVLDTLSIPLDSEVQFKLNWDRSEFVTPYFKSLARITVSSE